MQIDQKNPHREIDDALTSTLYDLECILPAMHLAMQSLGDTANSTAGKVLSIAVEQVQKVRDDLNTFHEGRFEQLFSTSA